MTKPTANTLVQDFSALGLRINEISEQELDELYLKASGFNNWFTRESIKNALNGMAAMLEKEQLEKWIGQTEAPYPNPKIIGLVLAGNIPFVGFQDYICALASGHQLIAKTASQDPFLPVYIHQLLSEINPHYSERVIFTQGRLTDFDAIIATGSDNSARYFDYYFGKYPNIIRKNRSSVAVISGTESEAELRSLGHDIFDYYGLGCRNVSKLLVPQNYDFNHLLNCFADFKHVLDHHKYANNYDYNKSIYLVNRVPHLDTGFLLLKEDQGLVSPISVLFYEEYQDHTLLDQYLQDNQEKIQCVIGNNPYIPFGGGQRPLLNDYADGIDVMAFLKSL